MTGIAVWQDCQSLRRLREIGYEGFTQWVRSQRAEYVLVHAHPVGSSSPARTEGERAADGLSVGQAAGQRTLAFRRTLVARVWMPVLVCISVVLAVIGTVVGSLVLEMSHPAWLGGSLAVGAISAVVPAGVVWLFGGCIEEALVLQPSGDLAYWRRRSRMGMASHGEIEAVHCAAPSPVGFVFQSVRVVPVALLIWTERRVVVLPCEIHLVRKLAALGLAQLPPADGALIVFPAYRGGPFFTGRISFLSRIQELLHNGSPRDHQ